MNNPISKIISGNSLPVNTDRQTVSSSNENISIFLNDTNEETKNVNSDNNKLKTVIEAGKRNIDIENQNTETDELIEELKKEKSLIYNTADEIMGIIECSEDYDGDIPEYTNEISQIIKTGYIVAAEHYVRGLSDNEKYSKYDFLLETAKEETEKINKNNNLKPELKNLKLKFYNDQISVLKELKNGVSNKKNSSILKGAASQIVSAFFPKSERLKPYEDQASKLVDLFFPQAQRKNVISLEDTPNNVNKQNNDVKSEDNLDYRTFYVRNSNGRYSISKEWLEKINGSDEKRTEELNNDMNNFMKFLKENEDSGKTQHQITKEYNTDLTKNINDISELAEQTLDEAKIDYIKNKFTNQLTNEMREKNLTTHEFQAVFLSSEQKSCNNDINMIKQEIENRKNNKGGNDKFKNWSDEKLKNAQKLLEEKSNVIHGYYRQIIPSWFDGNADKVCELLMTAVGQTADKNSHKTKKPLFYFEYKKSF